MPNRIIKESICVSDDINELSWFEECFFYRLIVNCDDYGRLDARPQILKAKLFPLKDGVTASQIEKTLSKLSTAGMVLVYEYDQKPFLQLMSWGDHQRIRNLKEKYPAPSEKAKLRKVAANCGEARPESESNPNTNQNPNPSNKPGADKPAPDSPIVISLTLNDKTEYPVYESDVTVWTELYPVVDVMGELRKMKGWLDANQRKRKTKAGIKKFINGWLARQQDSGKGGGNNAKGSTDQFSPSTGFRTEL